MTLAKEFQLKQGKIVFQLKQGAPQFSDEFVCDLEDTKKTILFEIGCCWLKIDIGLVPEFMVYSHSR